MDHITWGITKVKKKRRNGLRAAFVIKVFGKVDKQLKLINILSDLFTYNKRLRKFRLICIQIIRFYYVERWI